MPLPVSCSLPTDNGSHSNFPSFFSSLKKYLKKKSISAMEIDACRIHLILTPSLK
jgi:hypothetical protein